MYLDSFAFIDAELRYVEALSAIREACKTEGCDSTPMEQCFDRVIQYILIRTGNTHGPLEHVEIGFIYRLCGKDVFLREDDMKRDTLDVSGIVEERAGAYKKDFDEMFTLLFSADEKNDDGYLPERVFLAIQDIMTYFLRESGRQTEEGTSKPAEILQEIYDRFLYLSDNNQ